MARVTVTTLLSSCCRTHEDEGEGEGARWCVGKSTGNLRVSGAVPVPNLPKNPHPHGGYGFSNRYAAGDPYSYPHGFTCGYEQMGSTCQQARIHSQMVILRVYTCLRACARESGEVALVVRERVRVRARVRAMARHYRCRRHPRHSVVDLALSSGRGRGHIVVVVVERERERACRPERG